MTESSPRADGGADAPLPPRRDVPLGEIPSILAERRYEDLLGCPESEHLDFKRSGYRLERDQQKWELAKDVAGLANAGGGLIVIGVVARSPSTAEEELAVEVRPVPADTIPLPTYKSVIHDWCYPAIPKLRFDWYPAADGGSDAAKGILVIRVPEQPSDDAPVITVRAVGPDDKVSVVFGLPIRDGTDTRMRRAGELWRLLNGGHQRRNGSTSESDQSEQAPPPTPASLEDVAGKVETIVTELEQYMGWTDATTLALAAVPARPAARPPEGFYTRDGLWGALHRPPTIRDSGFALTWNEEPQRDRHALIVNAGRERCLRLETDGTLVAATNASSEFLSWTYQRRDDAPGPLPINQYVLTEYTYLFARFVHDHLTTVYGGYEYVVCLRGARDRTWTVSLSSSGPRGIGWREGRSSSDDNPIALVELGEDAEHDAYKLIGALYDMFGVDRRYIQFATESGAIDPAGLST